MPFRTSLLLLLALLLTNGMLGCRREAPAPTMATVRAASEPDQESWQTRYAISENGKPRVHIDATYMAQFEHDDSTYTLLRGGTDSLGYVTAYLFDENGDSSAVLTANEILYYDADERYEARGDVTVVTQEEKRLWSEFLSWHEAEREIRTPGFVRIVTPTERIQGYALVADEDLATYTLSRVTGRVVVDED